MNQRSLAYARSEYAAGRVPSFEVWGVFSDFWLLQADGKPVGRSFASREAAAKAGRAVVAAARPK